MKKNLKVKAAALNIKTLSHDDPATYVRLMSQAFDLRLPVKLKGDRHALLLSFGRINNGPLEGLYSGDVGTYVRLELEDSWLNTERLEPANAEELRRISIPGYLEPKFKIIPYLFDPATHILVYEMYHGGPLTSAMPIKDYFTKLLTEPNILEEFSTVEVILIQSAETISEILALAPLQTLDIDITIPNALGPKERAIVRELELQKASAKFIRLRNRRGQSLDPNADTKAEMAVALANGGVQGVGVNPEGQRVTLSTQDKPEIKEASYPPESSHIEALAAITKNFVRERREEN